MATNKKSTPVFFYLGDNLYRHLSQNRARDLIWVFSYTTKKREMLVLSEVRRKLEKGYPVAEVSRLLNLERWIIYKAIKNGLVDPPQRAYSLIHFNDEGYSERTKKEVRGTYIFSKKEVLRLHEVLGSIARGRPRKDGFVFSRNGIIDRESLRMALNTGKIMYVKDDKGEMIPLWKSNQMI